MAISKINSKSYSTLDATKLTGNMSSTNMPTGTIIKTTRGNTGNEGTGNFNISSTSFTDTTVGFTINKSVSGSYLVGTMILSFGSDFTNTKWINNHLFKRSSTVVMDTPDTTDGFFWHLGDDQNHRRDYYWYTTAQLYDSTTSTGDLTYDWYVKAHSNSGNIRGGGIRYIIHEITT